MFGCRTGEPSDPPARSPFTVSYGSAHPQQRPCAAGIRSIGPDGAGVSPSTRARSPANHVRQAMREEQKKPGQPGRSLAQHPSYDPVTLTGAKAPDLAAAVVRRVNRDGVFAVEIAEATIRQVTLRVYRKDGG